MKRENLKRANDIDVQLTKMDKSKDILDQPEDKRDVSFRIETDKNVTYVNLSKEEADMVIAFLLEERSYDYNQLLKELETL